MSRKKQYYNIENMLKTNAQYMMLLGQRSNGKSYQAKETVLKAAYENDYKFVYLRRWREDIKVKSVQAYFGDVNVSKITNKEWTGIKAWNGDLYFSRTNENGEEEKSESIGRYCALNEAERYKSWVFTSDKTYYAYIIYEEFITDKVYLQNEPTTLQQFVSTVARHKELHCMLIGNTLSRVCPYFNEWCLDGVLNQKQGTIEIYHFHVQETIIDIAVEYCTNANFENKMFFGQAAKQIVTGEWDTTDVPKLPRKQYEYECIYKVLIIYQKFAFMVELLIEPKEGGKICFVYPYKRKFDKVEDIKNKRIITNTFSDLPYINCKLDITKKAEYYIAECFRMDKVCYSDNMTGSDFKNVMKVFKFS